ncbi:uncharacterized protein DNG_05238 [Cephalotrichum gorgonifer]|uniref:HNH nuclease domain-containing protein n=1 Tax=Cephalotrichum gorgonifer TaxID=2041049 RepID=A0AAE8SVA4_9PEZI|nr:uncharacterized protein DNG_05238 [Cephalotrichum gorgonifer]
MESHSHNLNETFATHMGERRMERILDFYSRDPETFDTILEDDVKQEAVLDYITDIEIRRDIFLEFQALTRSADPSAALNGIALGIIMVSPIDQLRIRLDEMRTSVSASYGILDTLRGAAAINGIKAFVVKGGRQPSLSSTPKKRDASETLSPSQTPSKKQCSAHTRSRSDSNVPHPSAGASAPNVSLPPMRSPGSVASVLPGTPQEVMGNEGEILATPKTKRKVDAANAAKERDSWKCVLSGMEDPEAAHIFPFSTTEKRKFLDLNRMLRIFWGAEQAQSWAELFESMDVTESARNLICFNHQLHWWLDSAKMALKPLKVIGDGAVLVQFHWLKGNNLKPHVPLEKPYQSLPFTDILAKAGLSDNRAWGSGFAHRRSGIPLRTGQTFVLGARDPERAPNFELLKLSWDLLRVAAISGAALPGSLADEGSNRDDYPGAGCLVWEEDDGWDEYGRRGDEEGEPETTAEDKYPS